MKYLKTSRELVLVLILVHLMYARSDINPKDPVNSIIWLEKMFSKTSPYEKFGFTYLKLNSCGLRYLQKRAVCEEVFSSRKFRLNMLPLDMDYPDLSCKTVNIDVTGIPGMTDQNSLSLSMYECPNSFKMEVVNHREPVKPQKPDQFWELTQEHEIVLEFQTVPEEQRELNVVLEKKAVPFFMPVHFFVAGGLYPDSVVVCYQHASLEKLPVKFRTVLWNFPVNKLQDIYQQMRDEQEPTVSRKFTERIERRDRIVGPVHRSSLDAESKVGGSHVLKDGLAYNKFLANYGKINICPLTKKEKLNLCRQVFENDAYQLSIAEVQDGSELVCRKRKVAYSYSQFQSVQVALMKCPTEGTTNSYFLAAIHQLWSLVAFIQIPPFLEILPDACLTEINPKKLRSLPRFIRKQLRKIRQKKKEWPRR